MLKIKLYAPNLYATTLCTVIDDYWIEIKNEINSNQITNNYKVNK